MDIQDFSKTKINSSEIASVKRSVVDAEFATLDWQAQDALQLAGETIQRLEEVIFNLEKEKNLILCLLTKDHPSMICPHVKHESGWDHQDGWVLYIHLNSGQVSFHIDDHIKSLVSKTAMPAKFNVWDGHDLDTKWKRVIEHILE
jgi:hypothetical protein